MNWREDAAALAGHLLSDGSKGRRRRSGSSVRGRCPLPDHEDKHPSFGYDEEKDAWACSCGSGKGSELRERLGWKTAAAIPPPVRPARRPAPQPAPRKPNGNPDAVHEYAGGNRKLKFRHADGSKTIRWEHLDGGEWKSGMTGDPGLYRAASIAAAELILICESETDADALAERGFSAVATAFGAGCPINELQARAFAGKFVAIMEHQDDAGRTYAAACREVLETVAEEAFIVRPPEPHKDVRDWILAESPERDEIEGLVDAARPRHLLAVASSELFAGVDERVDWILEPMIARGSLLQIQGNPKGGKSAFSLYLAVSAASGRFIAGRFDYVPAEPSRVVYVSYEDSLRRLKRRVREFLPGLGLDDYPANLLLFPRVPEIDLSEKTGELKLRRIIRRNSPDIIVLDTLSYLHSGDENKKQDMQPVMAAFRRLVEEFPVALVLIHHTRKTSHGGDQATVSERGRGSSAIAAAADCLLDFGARVQPNTTYCRLISKDVQDDEFHVVYRTDPEAEDVRWSIVDVEEREDVLQSQMKVEEAVRSLLATSPDGVIVSTVAKALPNVAEITVRRHMKTLVRKGILEVHERQGPKNANLYKVSNPIT